MIQICGVGYDGSGEGNVAQGLGNMQYSFSPLTVCTELLLYYRHCARQKGYKTNNHFSGVHINEKKEICKHATDMCYQWSKVVKFMGFGLRHICLKTYYPADLRQVI